MFSDASDNSHNYHNPQTLYEHLNSCLHNLLNPRMSEAQSTTSSNSEEDSGIEERIVNSNRLWITKWVDYSNKYGFGAHLSNGCIVIRYNDGTTLAVDALKR